MTLEGHAYTTQLKMGKISEQRQAPHQKRYRHGK